MRKVNSYTDCYYRAYLLSDLVALIVNKDPEQLQVITPNINWNAFNQLQRRLERYSFAPFDLSGTWIITFSKNKKKRMEEINYESGFATVLNDEVWKRYYEIVCNQSKMVNQ